MNRGSLIPLYSLMKGDKIMSKDYWRDHFELALFWMVFCVGCILFFWCVDTLFVSQATASNETEAYEIQCRKPSGEIGTFLTKDEIPVNRAVFTFYTVENVRIFSTNCHAEIKARGGR